jgi:hypothetical protein
LTKSAIHSRLYVGYFYAVIRLVDGLRLL